MKISETTERRIFLASVAGFLILIGVLAGLYAPPVKWLAGKATNKITDFQRNGLSYMGLRPTGHLEPFRADIINAVKVDPNLAAPGVVLATGLFGDKLGARLYDNNGDIVYEWPNDFFSLFAEQRKYKFGSLVHGDYLYPNGDLLVTIDQVGMARIGACGDVKWANANGAHHSIDVDDDGYVWAPQNALTYNDPRLAGRPIRVDRIGKYDPETGDVVESIDLENILVANGNAGIVKGNVPRRDLFHLNDVEILKKKDVAAFPKFSAGDIMLSSRNTNIIMVVDGRTREITWWRNGPMHGQHDPDFDSDGTITVLDNRPSEGETMSDMFNRGGGSRIIALDPDDFETRAVYASDSHNKFYTAYRGKHQNLENGNVLIAETDGGRAFEAAPDGRIAWMIVNKYDDKDVGWVMSATRYPESYAAAFARCPKPQE